MNRLQNWINQILRPEDTILADGALDDILQALDSPAVRRRWVENLMNQLWESNIKLDRMMEQEQEHGWKKASMFRNSIVFCLNEILTAKDGLESEIHEQERRDRIIEQHRGSAAPIDSRR